MNKFLVVSVGVAILLGSIALGQIIGVKSQVSILASKAGESFGAVVHNVQEQFSAGAKFGRTDQLTISNTGAITSSVGVTTTGAISAGTYASASVGSSSSTPAALGSAVAGHIIIASAATTAQASTTAVTANSIIQLTQEFVSPIAGTTCKTSSATTTPAISTITAGNGFIVTMSGAVTGNTCLSYLLIN